MEAPAQPDVNIESTASTNEKKNKKKKKRVKLTPKQKQIEKLEKNCEKLIKDCEKYNEFIRFMVYWLKDRQVICYKLLHKHAQNLAEKQKFVIKIKKDTKKILDLKNSNEEEEEADEDDELETTLETNLDFKVSYDDFKLIMQDVDIPCTNVELHLLCKLLDKDEIGFIDYRKFTSEYIQLNINYTHQDAIRHIKSALFPINEKTSKPGNYPVFAFRMFESFGMKVQPKYIYADIKLVTFADSKDYRGHLKSQLLHTHMTIYSLIELIREKTDLAAIHKYVSIFRDSTRSKSSKLDESKTLEECGYTGGAYEEPKEYVLFYDYTISYSLKHDPIINSDFYFINNYTNKSILKK